MGEINLLEDGGLRWKILKNASAGPLGAGGRLEESTGNPCPNVKKCNDLPQGLDKWGMGCYYGATNDRRLRHSGHPWQPRHPASNEKITSIFP